MYYAKLHKLHYMTHTPQYNIAL